MSGQGTGAPGSNGPTGGAPGSRTPGLPPIEVAPGLYEHVKGNRYEVLELARHSETEEWFVVYRALYGERGLWVRPLAMFAEHVVVDGLEVPRFRHLGPA